MNETIEEYLARGGEIEECPPKKAGVISEASWNKRNRRVRNRLRRKYREYTRKNKDK